MGWDGWHLHQFSDDRREWDEATEKKMAVRNLLSRPGGRLLYTYDFGDGWEHEIILEDIIHNDPAVTSPACLEGSGACPPEDCGGAWGYAALKEILADRGHEEHEDKLEWLGLASGGDFDPAEFSADEVNARLSQLRTTATPATAAVTAPAVVRVQPRAKKTKAKRTR
jgi:hypothetical protein